MRDFKSGMQAEEQLRLQSVALESAANGIVITNRMGEILWINPAVTVITGYSAEEVLGRTPRLFRSDVHPNAYFQELWSTILSGQIWHGETVNRRKDGSLYTEEQTIAPVRDAEGEITHFISIKQDITLRKAAEDALQRRAERIEAFNQVLQTLLSTLDLRLALQAILQALEQFVPHDSVSVMLLEGHELEIFAVHGVADPDEIVGQKFDIRAEDNPNAEVVRTQAPLRLGDAPVSYESFCSGVFAPQQIRSWLGVPMMVDGRVAGMLTLDKREPNFFTEEHAQLVLTFTAQAAIAIKNARLYTEAQQELKERQRAEAELRQANDLLQVKLAEIEALQAQLREQAIRDGLTGLYNRRYLDEMLGRELSRAARKHMPVSLIMLDIDHFKSFNDQYGHEVGDRVLQELGRLLLKKARREDIPCRYGGEEFLVVLWGADLEAAQGKAEQWRQAFSELRVLHQGIMLHATLSAGVATYPEHGEKGADVLRRADQAMYAAKHAGRNQVIGWSELLQQG